QVAGRRVHGPHLAAPPGWIGLHECEVLTTRHRVHVEPERIHVTTLRGCAVQREVVARGDPGHRFGGGGDGAEALRPTAGPLGAGGASRPPRDEGGDSGGHPRRAGGGDGAGTATSDHVPLPTPTS